MRRGIRIVSLLVVVLLVPASATGAGSFVAHLSAPNHRPLANKLWPISFTATTKSGKPLRAVAWYEFWFGGQRVALAHPTPKTPCDSTQDKKPVPVPFTGKLADKLLFPPRSEGFPLTLRVVVKVKGVGVKNLDWKIVVRKSPYKHCIH